MRRCRNALHPPHPPQRYYDIPASLQLQIISQSQALMERVETAAVDGSAANSAARKNKRQLKSSSHATHTLGLLSSLAAPRPAASYRVPRTPSLDPHACREGIEVFDGSISDAGGSAPPPPHPSPPPPAPPHLVPPPRAQGQVWAPPRKHAAHRSTARVKVSQTVTRRLMVPAAWPRRFDPAGPWHIVFDRGPVASH